MNRFLLNCFFTATIFLILNRSNKTGQKAKEDTDPRPHFKVAHRRIVIIASCYAKFQPER